MTTYTEKTREHLADCLRPALARMEVFASELSVYPHTLQNNLRAEGTTWRDLLRAEVLSQVSELRAQGVSEKDIADELGYYDLTSYRRALRRAVRIEARRAAAS